MYLLDTNVVSELRKGSKAHQAVRAWNKGVAASACYLAAVSLFELRLGALLRRRRDPDQGEVLLSWIRQVETNFGPRILDTTSRDWIRAAKLHVPDPRPLRDSLIAATALNHGLVVVTRSVVDFERMAVELIDPWTHGP